VIEKLNRKNDYFFRKLFSDKELLARLLTVILGVQIESDELTLTATVLTPDFIKDKESVLDIAVERSAFHERMNIEIQTTDEKDFDRRMLLYWARSYMRGFQTGQPYSELPKQICILIADFVKYQYEDKRKYHSVFQVKEKTENTVFSNAFELHVIELPKLPMEPSNSNIVDPLEDWVKFINNAEGDILEQIVAREPLIGEALVFEQAFLKSGDERLLYEMREKGRSDFASHMYNSKQKGIEEGIESRNIEIVKNMLDNGVSIELIERYTGLTSDFIKGVK
jgi:predicted transposase/invertase (TIGR01784 family)